MVNVFSIHTNFGRDYWVIAKTPEAALAKFRKQADKLNLLLDSKERPDGVTLAGTVEIP